jgi:hypothetical protein
MATARFQSKGQKIAVPYSPAILTAYFPDRDDSHRPRAGSGWGQPWPDDLGGHFAGGAARHAQALSSA